MNCHGSIGLTLINVITYQGLDVAIEDEPNQATLSVDHRRTRIPQR